MPNRDNYYFVQIENEEAYKVGRMLPIKLDDCAFPLQFRHLQAADFKGWDHSSSSPQVQELVEKISSMAMPLWAKFSIESTNARALSAEQRIEEQKTIAYALREQISSLNKQLAASEDQRSLVGFELTELKDKFSASLQEEKSRFVASIAEDITQLAVLADIDRSKILPLLAAAGGTAVLTPLLVVGVLVHQIAQNKSGRYDRMVPLIESLVKKMSVN